MSPSSTIVDSSSVPPVLAGSVSSRQVGASGMIGLPLGTQVSTAEGLLPVEWLTSGDRIVTRSGMTRLLRVDTAIFSGRLVVLPTGAFGPARPSRPIPMPSGQRVYLGKGQSMPLSALSAELRFPHEEATEVRLFRLIFARPEIVTAGGVQVCCGDAAGPVGNTARHARSA